MVKKFGSPMKFILLWRDVKEEETGREKAAVPIHVSGRRGLRHHACKNAPALPAATENRIGIVTPSFSSSVSYDGTHQMPVHRTLTVFTSGPTMKTSRNQNQKTPVTIPDSDVEPQAIKISASDGFTIGAFVWRLPSVGKSIRPVAIVNPATSVRCRYYFRFAAFLFRNGFDVILYDYRGIGDSRPPRLRGLNVSWLDWGSRDFEAVLNHASVEFPGQPIDVVAHSVGGVVLGLAPSNHLIRRAVMVGAQYAYWRDYAPDARLKMIAKWHVFMPLVTAFLGYFPGKSIGWLEDTPKGVVRDWAFGCKHLEDRSRWPVQQFNSVAAPLLAISLTDDEFGTIPVVERLIGYFDACPRTHLRIFANLVNDRGIGHFGFFNRRFEDGLWKIPLDWLRIGRLPDDIPGEIIKPFVREASFKAI